MKKTYLVTIIVLLIVLILAVLTVLYYLNQTDEGFCFGGKCNEQPLEGQVNVTDYDYCVKAGYPIMESYPEQCSDGTNTYVHKLDKILLENLKSGQEISSPLKITGSAPGDWYFEADFPVVLTDWDGLIIAEGYAGAIDSWMTERYVPFKATLTFEKPTYKNNGTLIFQKDNPSGLPENDDSFEVPILFK